VRLRGRWAGIASGSRRVPPKITEQVAEPKTATSSFDEEHFRQAERMNACNEAINSIVWLQVAKAKWLEGICIRVEAPSSQNGRTLLQPTYS